MVHIPCPYCETQSYWEFLTQWEDDLGRFYLQIWDCKNCSGTVEIMFDRKEN